MQHGFSLNPGEILGVEWDASLQEIRDAYREKAKRYHPDHGGDEWVFRVVSRAYEILSTARIAGRSSPGGPGPGAAAPQQSPFRTGPATGGTKRDEWTRAGIRDAVGDPARLVDVELFVLRYAITDPMQALFQSPEDRDLSCTLNLTWPGKAFAASANPAAEDAILPLVSKAFAPLARKTRAVGSQGRVEDGRFAGWLSYATVAKANDALQALHKAFLAQGLGLHQWTREMSVPRDDS